MSQHLEASLAEPAFSDAPDAGSPRWSFVTSAPADEPTVTPSKSGRSLGLLLAVGGGALFWGGSAAAIFLRH